MSPDPETVPDDDPLERRVTAAMAFPPLSEIGDEQRRELADVIRDAATVEDLPGRWQAAILQAEKDATGRVETHRACDGN